MEQIDVHAPALTGSWSVEDGVGSRPRVVRLDATTYGVKDHDEDRWHWVYRPPAQQRWTCGCAQGRSCRHIDEVLQKVRYRDLWSAV